MSEYMALTEADQTKLRQERVRLLEAELFRACLQREEAQSEGEQDAMDRDIGELKNRLSVHYAALGITQSSDA